ncbi:hypothetical protein [Pontibacter actiniarum]|nr:hypothetical protein [Pontibacter actiniarum]
MQHLRLRPFPPLLPPGRVLADFCQTYPPQEAQRLLWQLALPVFLDSFETQDAAHTNQLIAFYEGLELLLQAVHHTRQGGGETGPPPTAEAP